MYLAYQVTIVPLGSFATNSVAVGMVKIPPHPAYTNPALPSVTMRRGILASATSQEDPNFHVGGDPAMAAKTFYRLSELASPPLRLPLGKDSVELCRGKLSSFSSEVEKYASWSDGLSRP